MPEPTDWRWWFDAWEAHMAGFLPDREAVLELLCEVLADLTGPAPRILELGCGTGSLAARVVTELPDASVVGVDLDPLLTTVGAHVLGDLDGRLRRHEADLRDADWHRGLTPGFDAVISVAALHMLGADGTARVLTDLAGLLRPGGVLLDLDWAAPVVGDGRLATAWRRREQQRDDAAASTTFSRHRAALKADPELARLDALRRQRFGTPPEQEPTYLDADGHQRALLDAGFTSAVEVWRHLDLALIAAVRWHPTPRHGEGPSPRPAGIVCRALPQDPPRAASVTAGGRRRAIQDLWTAGDYARVGALFEPAALQVVEHLELAGDRVLDAGTGTGNAALAAARTGADVAACDLTPTLLDIARHRAASEGLTIEWREGDLLDIPWPDTTFDVTLSVFAAFLADDPARCLAELARVTRPGGQVVTTTWSDEAIFLRMMRVAHRHDPDIVRTAEPGPFADPERLHQLAAETSIAAVTLTEHELPLPFGSAEAAVAFFEETSGPVQMLAAAFGDRWASVRADIIGDWRGVARRRPDGTVLLPATYWSARMRLSS